MPIPSLPSDQLTQLAKDFAAGRVFSDRHCRNNDEVGMVFMMIPLGAFTEVPREDIEDIGMVYEYLDRAGPMSVNGMPMFLSLRLLNRADTQTLIAKVKRITEAVNAAAV